MDQTMIIVSTVVASLGVLSAILGFSAEGTKLTLRDLLETEDGVCIYPENSALGLGICAAIFLIITQATIATVGGCCGCCKSRAIPSESKRIIGVVCAVFSWIAAVVAFALLVEGAAWNANVERNSSAYGFCYVLKDGIFAGAAVLTLVATALGLNSYLLLRGQPDAASAAAAAKTGVEQPPAGISMGQPQFPHAASPTSGEAPTRIPPPPPTGGYGAEAPHHQQQQFPSAPPAHGYEPHAPNQQYYPPPQGHEQV